MFNKLHFTPLNVRFVALMALYVMLSACSIVQWLPSSACEKVLYERVARNVTVYAECQV